MKTTTFTALPASLLALLMIAGSAQAASPQHVDQLAARARQQAIRISRQTNQIPGRGPRVRYLQQLAANCYGITNRIHQIAHSNTSHNTGFNRRGGNPYVSQRPNRTFAINQQLRRLDADIHRMADEVYRMKQNMLARRTLQGSPSPVGHVGRGLVAEGPNSIYRQRLAALNRLQRTMGLFEGTVHHLMDDTKFSGRRSRTFGGNGQSGNVGHNGPGNVGQGRRNTRTR